MKICFFGIYDPNYSRNSILLAGLREMGVEVVECRADSLDPKRYQKLWKSLRALNNEYDYIYAAYPSPVATIIARIASKKSVVCDAFYSMYDSVVNDRREIKWWHPRAIKLLLLDWLAVMLAHVVVTDTEAQRQYWSSWFLVNGAKIHTVYLGFNDKFFYPMSAVKKDYFLVYFYGTYIPVQGIDKIIEAARICEDIPQIQFRLIGAASDSEKVLKFTKKYKPKNIEFIGRVALSELNTYMAPADLVLGIFGDIERGRRAIPNKVYDGLAAGKPVMTMEAYAVREVFSEQEVFFVKTNPESIASGIKKLFGDRSLLMSYAKNGYNAVSKYKPINIARLLISVLSKHV